MPHRLGHIPRLPILSLPPIKFGPCHRGSHHETLDRVLRTARCALQRDHGTSARAPAIRFHRSLDSATGVSMLTFQDFIPQIQKTVFGFPTEYEDINEVLTRLSSWVEREQIQVLNVETLLLSILPNEHEQGAPVRITGALGSVFQVFRVWYHNSPPRE